MTFLDPRGQGTKMPGHPSLPSKAVRGKTSCRRKGQMASFTEIKYISYFQDPDVRFSEIGNTAAHLISLNFSAHERTSVVPVFKSPSIPDVRITLFVLATQDFVRADCANAWVFRWSHAPLPDRLLTCSILREKASWLQRAPGRRWMGRHEFFSAG